MIKLKGTWLIYILIIYILVIIETSFFPQFRFFQVKPDLVLLFVVSVALLKGYWEGAVLGIVAGFFMGIISWNLCGIYMLPYALAGFFAGQIKERVEPDNILVPLLSSLGASALFSFIFWFLGSSLEIIKTTPQDFVNSILFILLNILFSLPIFYFVRFVLFSSDDDVLHKSTSVKGDYLLQ
jgi:rod shape-determining protein MreD